LDEKQEYIPFINPNIGNNKGNGQPALSPVRLMLNLILQFMEGLSDPLVMRRPETNQSEIPTMS
jgi:hypothetical protein